MSAWKAWGWIGIATWLLHCAAATADQPRGIVVTGRGVVRARPALAELAVVISGRGATAKKALEGFRKQRAATLKGLAALALEQLTVTGEGIALGSPFDEERQVFRILARAGGAPAAQKPPMYVQERLWLTLRGIDKLKRQERVDTLARILDAVSDMGEGGEVKPVTYKLADLPALRRKAAELAMSDAREQARRLAGLAGVALGPVRGVQVVESDEQHSSPSLQPIAVGVSLTVAFAIK